MSEQPAPDYAGLLRDVKACGALAEAHAPLRYLTAWRERSGLSVRAVAEKSGVPLVTIYHAESGHGLPDLSQIEAIAAAIGVNWQVLFFEPREDNEAK